MGTWPGWSKRQKRGCGVSNWFQFELSVQLGRWAVEFSRDDGFIGLWLGLLRYSESGGSCYPRWQWAIERKRWPKTMRREEMPVFECTGVRIAPGEVMRDEPWPELIGDGR